MLNGNTNNNNNKNSNSDDQDTVDGGQCGQLTLDRLLASLAVETDIMDQHLAQINGNCRNSDSFSPVNGSSSSNEVFTYPNPLIDQNQNTVLSTTEVNGIDIDSGLNDVIANLTDFTRHETMRQLSLANGNSSPIVVHNNHINGRSPQFETNSTVMKRLASESDNSSSISPSFSERSNGVSWNDQVRIDLSYT